MWTVSANFKPADFAHDVSEAKQPPAGLRGNGGPVAEMLKRHLTARARERTIQRAVAGGRFCAVMLDDGGVGVAVAHVTSEPASSK